MTEVKRGALIQVDPAGPRLDFQFNPETLVHVPRKPRLKNVERPQRVSSQDWLGVEPAEVKFALLYDSLGRVSQHVSKAIRLLEGFASDTVRNDGRPAIVELDYDRYVGWRFVVVSVDYDEDEIREASLRPIRVSVNVVLREWIDAQALKIPTERVKSGVPPQAQKNKSVRVHTVVRGDTLWALAGKYLGSGSRFPEIAKLNNLADPNVIRVGQRLRIPAR